MNFRFNGKQNPKTSHFPKFLINNLILIAGKMYAVIGRRHGKILSGDLIHGSGNFSVTAILPVIESFNFAQEIRKQTSGLAYPQLVFSHWEVSHIKQIFTLYNVIPCNDSIQLKVTPCLSN